MPKNQKPNAKHLLLEEKRNKYRIEKNSFIVQKTSEGKEKRKKRRERNHPKTQPKRNAKQLGNHFLEKKEMQ